MKFESLPLAATLLAGAASAFQIGGKPMPQPKTTMADNFPWRDPFTSKTTDSYSHTCEASKTFAATQYTLHDLFEKPPTGLFHWGDGLKTFFSGREYPGGWAGLDRHMYDRNLLKMEYADLPLRVREWIEEQERVEDSKGKGLFAIFDKPTTAEEKITDLVVVPKAPKDVNRDLDQKRVAIFAPGALYHILPLFVAEGSDCQATLTNLENYSPTAKDAAVVAWPISHTRPNIEEKKRDIEFTIKAQVLKIKESAKEAQKEAVEEPPKAAEDAKKAAPSEQAKDEL
ncbi:uncharacterized protein CTRU02_214992 [Colletotrichum truncatum]|uniref:Uncharacterized protein n=1 Tax=Colletotrichum truncatum TaxID=5467 RepID=A0ACC3YE92_COLTU|nr:uncharacterized protein CTRU02_08256 [Colletotrichum truncatum]KAF6790127.1 hypothetical protein CTRU02_08256 [Colletotrichum truncatum]